VTTGTTLRAAEGAPELAIDTVGFHALGEAGRGGAGNGEVGNGEVVAANLGDARESDTTPATALALGGRVLAPPDPPAPRGFVRLPALALLLAAALGLVEWVASQRRWTS